MIGAPRIEPSADQVPLEQQLATARMRIALAKPGDRLGDAMAEVRRLKVEIARTKRAVA